MQVRRTPPPLDAHRLQLAGGHQLLGRGTGWADPDPVVVGKVVGAGDPVGPGGASDQLEHRLVLARARARPAPPAAAPARAGRSAPRTGRCDPRSRARRSCRAGRAPCAPPTSSSPSCPWRRGVPSSRSRAVTGPRLSTSLSTRSRSIGSMPGHHLNSRPAKCAIRNRITGHSSTGMNACTCAQYSTTPARPALGRAPQQVDVVGPHPGVERHVVRALEHVDRVDLEHAGARRGCAVKVRRVGGGCRGRRSPGRRARSGGPGERRATARGQTRARHRHRQSASARSRARPAFRGRRTWPPPSASAAAASPACCGRGS